MTCPGCERENVALIGGYCGMCTSWISAAVQTSLDDLSILEGAVHDVSMAKDGYLHIRVDVDDGSSEGRGEGSGGEADA